MTVESLSSHGKILSTTEVLVSAKGGCTLSNDMEFHVPSRAVYTTITVTAVLYRSCLDTQQLYSASEYLGCNAFVLSLLLELKPEGQQFACPVQVKLSHAAANKGWRLLLFRSKKYQQWESIVDYCVDSGKLAVRDCDYSPETNTLYLTHFCRHCWVGVAQQSARKQLYCSLFATSLEEFRDCWSLRVFLHDASDTIFEVGIYGVFWWLSNLECLLVHVAHTRKNGEFQNGTTP